jgi:molecular chaperone GrpE
VTDVPPPDDFEEEPAHASEEGDGSPANDRTLDVEELIAQLESVSAERDEFLALAQSKQAEFENYRKRMMKQQADEVERAGSKLVDALLPVLDAFDYGVAHGDDSLAPMRAQLLGTLEREGLERLDPAGEAFDPKEHDAVAHEAGDGGEPVVAETLRAGYRWRGHLLRPVMVRVRD